MELVAAASGDRRDRLPRARHPVEPGRDCCATGGFYPDHGLERIVAYHERQDARFAQAAADISDATGKPILTATELAVAAPDNPGPRRCARPAGSVTRRRTARSPRSSTSGGTRVGDARRGLACDSTPDHAARSWRVRVRLLAAVRVRPSRAGASDRRTRRSHDCEPCGHAAVVGPAGARDRARRRRARRVQQALTLTRRSHPRAASPSTGPTGRRSRAQRPTFRWRPLRPRSSSPRPRRSPCSGPTIGSTTVSVAGCPDAERDRPAVVRRRRRPVLSTPTYAASSPVPAHRGRHASSSDLADAIVAPASPRHRRHHRSTTHATTRRVQLPSWSPSYVAKGDVGPLGALDGQRRLRAARRPHASPTTRRHRRGGA